MPAQLGRTRMQTLMVVGVSAASLTAIVALGVPGLLMDADVEAAELPRPTAEVVEDSELGEVRVEPPAALVPEPEVALEKHVDEPEPEPEPELDESTGVAMPDIAGLPLWVARKRAKKRGLTLVFRDGAEVLTARDYAGYRVPKTLELELGRYVAKGSEIEIEAERDMRKKYARGY